MQQQFDVIIIGNGLVGASLAAALAPQGKTIAIIDKNPILSLESTETDLDGRKIALSYGSYQLLTHYQIWSRLKPHATDIEQIQVSAQGQFGRCQITAEDIQQSALGYVVPATKLQQALQQTLTEHSNITLYCSSTLQAINLEKNSVTFKQHDNQQTLSAKLIIAADGTMSYSRQLLNIAVDINDYQQTAFVSSVQLQQTHKHTAYQRFSAMGTLAMLPMQHQTCGFVCTADTPQIEQLMQLSDQQLLADIQQHFGYRLGKLIALGQRYRYPLTKIIAKQQRKNNFLLLGNAAHNISPIAAQGFNLALQDIQCLAQLLQDDANNIDAVLTTYLKTRLPEQQKIIQFTDRLMQHTDNTRRQLPLTGMVLGLFDIMPSFKQQLAKQAAGISPLLKQLQRQTS